MTVLLDLLLGVLWALEGEILQSGKHSTSSVNSADQFVGGSEGHSECEVLGIFLGLLRGDDSCGTLEPSNNL